MPGLAVIRDQWLNPWDCGNYYGVIDHGIDLYLCGRGYKVPWAELDSLYPKAKVCRYVEPWDVLELEPDVIDLPDAHYGFTQEFVRRHDRAVVVAWDNLLGKNTLNPYALGALQRAWKCVARSELAEAMLVWDGVPKEKIVRIPGAVDTDFFYPDDQPRERAVLFVGRLVIEKGLLDLIWAMKGIDAELWIVGEGDRAYFQPWIDRAGVKVRWFGFLNRGELAEVHRRAMLLCVPSIPLLSYDVFGCWLEQFGQVFLEAMASGTPVVSTTSGAIPEVVGGGGIYIYPRDWGTLHTTLEWLLGDRDKWNIISELARGRVERLYSQAVVGKQIVEAYFG